jgi:hypothetical protein
VVTQTSRNEGHGEAVAVFIDQRMLIRRPASIPVQFFSVEVSYLSEIGMAKFRPSQTEGPTSSRRDRGVTMTIAMRFFSFFGLRCVSLRLVLPLSQLLQVRSSDVAQIDGLA